ncbi:hypothetical protein JQN58_13830 [Aneurinibacillus sp. BA2021]|nr:hypothetical protein [Aneurinibacillus sp. BA2021]
MKKPDKKKQIPTYTVRSVSYVHDPEAAQKWFEIYIDLIKQTLLKQADKVD